METISTYTRKQAIEDGVLIDVTEVAKLEGFRTPVAFTSEFHEELILAPCMGDNIPITHRLHEVLSEIRRAIKEQGSESPWLKLHLSTVDGDGVEYIMPCKVHSGPGDHGEHVLTVMMAHED